MSNNLNASRMDDPWMPLNQSTIAAHESASSYFQYEGAGELAWVMMSTKNVLAPNARSYCVRSRNGDSYQYIGGVTGAHERLYFSQRITQDGGTWEANTYNRMRIMMYLPADTYVGPDDGHTDWHIGTYMRHPNDPIDKQESATIGGEGHGYHYYKNIASDCWVQYVVDPQPDKIRNNKVYPIPYMEYPFADEPAFNYFDSFTDVYTKSKIDYLSYPQDVYCGHIELWKDNNPETSDYIYSLSSAYTASDDTYHLNWSRIRNRITTTSCEIRYAYSDIHTLGWANAISPPDNVALPPTTNDYHEMIWRSDQINAAGNDNIYFAIKHDLDPSFRQIVINNKGELPPVSE